VRRLGVPTGALVVGLLLAGCGGGSNNGTMPTPADDGSSGTTTTPSKSVGKPTAEPTGPAKTRPAKRAQVIIDPGNFADNPAVQGFVAKYPIYFRALVQRDSSIVRASLPAYFYTDTAAGIADARANGWVMRPPGSVVVVGIEQRPFDVVRVRSCRSQNTGYWDPKRKAWVRPAPKGTPDVIDMIERGDGWTLYRLIRPIPKAFSCANVSFPA
jgi:hypothetical protein